MHQNSIKKGPGGTYHMSKWPTPVLGPWCMGCETGWDRWAVMWTHGRFRIQVTLYPASHPEEERCWWWPGTTGGFQGNGTFHLWSWSIVLTAGWGKGAGKGIGGWRLRDRWVWRLLQGPAESDKGWTRAVPADVERKGGVWGGQVSRTCWWHGERQGPSFISNFPLWLPDNVTLERSN